MAEPIDLFAALRVKETRHGGSGRRRAADRMTIEIKAPALVFHADESAISGTLALAIEKQIRENLLSGQDPSGNPLPSPAAATLERREYREKQAQRGGEITDRIKDPKDRADGRKNWRRRFVAPRLGAFVPGQGVPRNRFGVESGMLAHSIKAAPEGDGYKVFFAGPRGNIDRSGANAVVRVFGRLRPWTSLAMKQPEIRAALRQTADSLVAQRGKKLLTETLKTLRALRELAGAIGS